MSTQSIGVEIHPGGVRVARARASAKTIQVDHAAEAEFPEGTTLTSLDVECLPEAVEAALDVRQFGNRPIVVVVDHPSVVLTSFSLAAGFTDELSTSIKWYAEQHVPYPVSTATVDFRVQESPYGGHKTVFLVSVARAVINKVTELLPPKRVRLSRIDAIPFSLGRLYHALVAGETGAAEPAVVAHANGSSGYVIVARAGRVEVARHLRLVEPIADSLCEKVQQTCRHYEFHHPTERIEAACATLPALAYDGMRERLEKELGVEVSALDPGVSATAVGRGSGANGDGGWAERFSLAVGAAI